MDYDKFIKLTDEIEEECKCPYCGGDYLTSVDFESLLFQCGDCGEYIEFDENKKPIPEEEE